LALRDKAHANGVTDVVLISADQARAMEPTLSCVAALHSPSTGIVDSHAFMLSLQGDFENAGGTVVCHAQVASAHIHPQGWVLHMADGTELLTRQLVNSAGLTAPALARQFQGLDAAQVPTAFFAKGNYFTLGMRAPFSRLIYPVPEAAGLGVHLTLDMGGQAKFGPDVQWVDDPDDLVVSRDHEAAFYQAVRAYWPDLPDGALQPGYAGIRPKISGPGQAAAPRSGGGPSRNQRPAARSGRGCSARAAGPGHGPRTMERNQRTGAWLASEMKRLWVPINARRTSRKPDTPSPEG
jgi:L-2-hydroxyglutarate oxidase LhgO